MAIEENFEKILFALRSIDERIDSLEEKIIIIGEKCDKMDNHINFINSVYDSVKTPFHYIMNCITLRSSMLHDRKREVPHMALR
jgi:hypothetical protein